MTAATAASSTGRIKAHAINPALQPMLSAIPALTLSARYRQGKRFAYMAGFREAARAILGERLAACVIEDLPLLEDQGRQRLGALAGELRARDAAFDHPAAKEIVSWLDGAYRPARSAPGG